MEGVWGILKREMYYKHKFHTREELVQAIMEYMDYYANHRPLIYLTGCKPQFKKLNLKSELAKGLKTARFMV